MTPKLLTPLLFSALLVGCSEPDAVIADTQRDDSGGVAEQANSEPETRTIEISGTVIFEERLGGVEVCADLRKTLNCNSDDPVTTTNPDGSYELSWESQHPHLDYYLIASWPRDHSAQIVNSLAPYMDTTKIGARDIHDGLINPLTTAEISTLHAMQRQGYSESEQQQGLDELRDLYAEIYQLPADEVYFRVTETDDYIDTVAIHNRLSSHTIGMAIEPLAPTQVTLQLKDEILSEVKDSGQSVNRFFIRESSRIEAKVRQTLVELGYLSDD